MDQRIYIYLFWRLNRSMKISNGGRFFCCWYISLYFERKDKWQHKGSRFKRDVRPFNCWIRLSPFTDSSVEDNRGLHSHEIPLGELQIFPVFNYPVPLPNVVHCTSITLSNKAKSWCLYNSQLFSFTQHLMRPAASLRDLMLTICYKRSTAISVQSISSCLLSLSQPRARWFSGNPEPLRWTLTQALDSHTQDHTERIILALLRNQIIGRPAILNPVKHDWSFWFKPTNTQYRMNMWRPELLNFVK